MIRPSIGTRQGACRTVTQSIDVGWIQRQFPRPQPGHSQSLCVVERKPLWLALPEGLNNEKNYPQTWIARVFGEWPRLTLCPAGLFEGDLSQHFWPACPSCPSSVPLCSCCCLWTRGRCCWVHVQGCTGSVAGWKPVLFIAFLIPVSSQVRDQSPPETPANETKSPLSCSHCFLSLKVLDSLHQGPVCVSWLCVLCWWMRSDLCKFW